LSSSQPATNNTSAAKNVERTRRPYVVQQTE
jgi:hypothetical protein